MEQKPLKKSFWDDEEEIEDKGEWSKEERELKWKNFVAPAIVFVLALVPRLYFLFVNDHQNVGYDWYGDVYHHWQIAYLTKTVGFAHGFLRLWDLKGMEYFWGLLQPLVLAILFTITNSANIIILRLLSIITGSIVIALIFLIVRKHFNASAAWASVLFLTFMPVILFSDTLGMQEPLSLMLLLFGVLVWPKYPMLTGASWGVAAMNRADYWLFSIGLFIAALLDKRRLEGSVKLRLFISWVIFIVFYMKYLASYTGNYIYPIYWNFLANGAGQWFEKKLNPYFPHEFFVQTRIIMFIVLIIAIVTSVIITLKNSKSYLFYLTGLFNLVLVGFMFSLAGYTWGYIDRFWVDRLFAWPYGFLGVLASIFVLYFLPSKIKIWGKLKIGWIVIFVLILGSQISWEPINYYWEQARRPWAPTVTNAQIIAKNWDGQGNMLLPENQPHLIYALVYNQTVTGEQIVGQMFDPFYYKVGKETTEEMDIKFIDWLKKNNISLVIVNSLHDSLYRPLFGRYPDLFKNIPTGSNFEIYKFFH